MANNGYDAELEKLAQDLREAKTRIKQLEDEIASTKAKRKELEEITIPDTMFQKGYTSVGLSSGSRFEVKPFYYARLFKGADGEVDKDRAMKFYDWLDRHEFGPLVKSHFEVWTTNPAVIQWMREACQIFDEGEIPFELSRGIHWKTLEAWFKEQTEKQLKMPDLFEHYVGRKATLK